MNQIISKFIFILFIAICAIQDKKERSVEDRILGVILSVISKRTFLDIIIAVIPGGLLILLAKITEEAIGTGDALFYLVSAMYMDVEDIMVMLFVSVFICGIVALFLVARQAIAVENRRDVSIPYLTIMFPVVVITLIL
ncbi:MAG: hypothetical protein Q4B86_00415 [Eubacteriales bacterium]|nr:hypothetical protein [Eubacteriales bacterium]